MSINGASTIFSFALWVIYVPIGWRQQCMKYWQPLLTKTTATCSLPHHENERQRKVNSVSCCIFGNQGIALIFAFITELLTAIIGNNTHQQKTFPSGRNGSVRVDALRQSRQRHPGGGLLRAWRQYQASRCTSPSDRSFAVSSSDSARAFSDAPESTYSYGGAFRTLRDLTIRIVKFWSS